MPKVGSGTGRRQVRDWHIVTAVTAAVLLVVAGVWLGGGLRVSPNAYPDLPLGAPVDLHRVSVVVHEVYRTNESRYGGPRKTEPTVVLRARLTVTMLDSKPGTFVGSYFLMKAGGEELTRERGGDSVSLQPGLSGELLVDFLPPPSGIEGIDAVDLYLSAPEYEWSNMINGGPEWTSIGTWVGKVPAIPVGERLLREDDPDEKSA